MERTIQSVVAEKVIEKSASVAEIVTDQLVQLEINKRVDIITKAVNRQDTLEKDLKKIDRNDVETYVDGNKTEVMSKARFEEIKKLKEKINNLTTQIDKALTENTADAYTKLADTLKKVDNAPGDKKEGKPESSE